jgi:hypothetical protein
MFDETPLSVFIRCIRHQYSQMVARTHAACQRAVRIGKVKQVADLECERATELARLLDFMNSSAHARCHRCF